MPRDAPKNRIAEYVEYAECGCFLCKLAAKASSGNIFIATAAVGSERYVFQYRMGNLNDLANVLGKFAESKELNMGWEDAAMVMKVARVACWIG